MGITTRDLDVIHLLEKNFLLNAEICSRLIYWTGNEHYSLNASRRRLKALHDLKQIKRVREFVGQSYTYYSGKKPTKTQHRLAMSDFLTQLTKRGFKVNFEETQSEFKGLEESYRIRPDMLVVLEHENKKYQLLVEIDLTKEFSHTKEYNKVIKDYSTNNLKALGDYPLAVVSVCNTQPQQSSFVWIKPDWSNFSNLTNMFS